MAVSTVITDELTGAPGTGAGSEVVMRPISPDWPEARVCARIDLALRMGIPWSVIAADLGVAGKREAKRLRRDLEHKVRLRQLAG
jgi:hypothetical protein